MVGTVQPGGPALLRRHNAALVLSVLLSESPLTRAEIARRAGLSKPTVRDVIAELLETGFVAETAIAGPTTRVGPRGRPVGIRGDGGHLLGVDIGANKVQTLVTDLTGRVLTSDRRETAAGDRPRAEPVLAQVRASITAALERSGIRPETVKAMGVGTPGDVDPATGEVTLAPQIEGLEGQRLKDLFESWFPFRVYLDNEVHLAVLGERWRGAARDIDDAVLVNVGIGIAAGILIGGSLHRGSTGAAGEIGYLPLVPASPDTRPGIGWGVLEYEAGGAGYARLARAAAEGPEGAGLRSIVGGHLDELDARAVFAAAAAGDDAAVRIVDRQVELLARAVASICLVLDPSTVILAGGVARAGSQLLDALVAKVEALVPRAPRIVLTALGDDAVALGAIYVAHQAAWSDLRASPLGVPA